MNYNEDDDNDVTGGGVDDDDEDEHDEDDDDKDEARSTQGTLKSSIQMLIKGIRINDINVNKPNYLCFFLHWNNIYNNTCMCVIKCIHWNHISNNILALKLIKYYNLTKLW